MTDRISVKYRRIATIALPILIISNAVRTGIEYNRLVMINTADVQFNKYYEPVSVYCYIPYNRSKIIENSPFCIHRSDDLTQLMASIKMYAKLALNYRRNFWRVCIRGILESQWADQKKECPKTNAVLSNDLNSCSHISSSYNKRN